MNGSTKFGDVSISEKSENRGLRLIAFGFSNVSYELSYTCWNALQPLFQWIYLNK